MSDTASIPNETSGLSLLSLSAAAASAAPIPLSPPSGPTTGITLGTPGSFTGSSGLAGSNGTHVATATGGISKHRRLSSTGKARRRLSDARDAASRPSATSLQTAAAALSSLATLSLSSSPPLAQGLPQSLSQTSQSFASASNSMVTPSAIPIPASRSTSVHTDNISKSAPLDDGAVFSSLPNGSTSYMHDSSLTKGGKKRGTTFTCESCSKVYRHPSCLIKHRWEHSPQWREASKFVLSKHQQVQLLEAAAILSHLSPDSTGTSLPEDRSLWPSFLSGGALPPPSNANMEYSSTSAFLSQPTSSSVPATSFMNATNHAPSAGPRLHDYSFPPAANGGGLTQLRPGLLGVPTGPGDPVSDGTATSGSLYHTTPGSLPVPVPKSDAHRHKTYGSISGKSEPWGSPASSHYAHHSYQPRPSSHSHSKSYTHSDETGGWSLPRSSVRSMSRSSRSRSPSASASGSKSDDENELVDVEDNDVFGHGRYVVGARGRQYGWKREDDDMSLGFSVQEEDEEEEEPRGGKEMEEDGGIWDGMDMDMVMD